MDFYFSWSAHEKEDVLGELRARTLGAGTSLNNSKWNLKSISSSDNQVTAKQQGFMLLTRGSFDLKVSIKRYKALGIGSYKGLLAVG